MEEKKEYEEATKSIVTAVLSYLFFYYKNRFFMPIVYVCAYQPIVNRALHLKES